MDKTSKIYIAGHNGLVGSSILALLKEKGYTNLIFREFKELDLRDQSATNTFFEEEKPEYVFLAAARVGGILANSTYKADFIYDNLMIASNVIYASYKVNVKKMLNLGSSCIYPKLAKQPIKEDYLLSGKLETTNEPYAIAKISAIKLCRYFNEQYGTNYISLMPTNLYGPGDSFNLNTSHVLPALIRKFYLAKLLEANNYEAIYKNLQKYDFDKYPNDKYGKEDIDSLLEKYGIEKTKVTLWGSGNVFREFLYVSDLAQAAIFLMNNYNYENLGEFINVGTGNDIKITDLADKIKEIIGFNGETRWDLSKPDGTPRKLLDISKIKDLGWRPLVVLEEGIEKTYEWLKKK